MTDDKTNIARNVLKKIVGSIKDDSRFLMDAVMDRAGFKTAQTHVDDMQFELDQVKAEITGLLKEEVRASRKLKVLRRDIALQESQVLAALKGDDEQNIYVLATELAETEFAYQNQLQVDQMLKSNIQVLQLEMECLQRQHKDMVRQLSMADTTRRIQQASELITKGLNRAGSNLLSAKASLDNDENTSEHCDEHPMKINKPKLLSAYDVINYLKDK